MVQPMNNVNIGSGALVAVFLLAAGAILAFGAWQGRRDLGTRGAQGVLAASLFVTLLPLVIGYTLLFRLSGSPLVTLVILNVAQFVLAFLPLYVAVNWMQIIREDTATRHGEGTLGAGRESA